MLRCHRLALIRAGRPNTSYASRGKRTHEPEVACEMPPSPHTHPCAAVVVHDHPPIFGAIADTFHQGGWLRPPTSGGTEVSEGRQPFPRHKILTHPALLCCKQRLVPRTADYQDMRTACSHSTHTHPCTTSEYQRAHCCMWMHEVEHAREMPPSPRTHPYAAAECQLCTPRHDACTLEETCHAVTASHSSVQGTRMPAMHPEVSVRM